MVKETCSKRFPVTPTLYDKVTRLLNNHKSYDDMITEMYNAYAKLHHIKEDTDGKESWTNNHLYF